MTIEHVKNQLKRAFHVDELNHAGIAYLEASHYRDLERSWVGCEWKCPYEQNPTADIKV